MPEDYQRWNSENRFGVRKKEVQAIACYTWALEQKFCFTNHFVRLRTTYVDAKGARLKEYIAYWERSQRKLYLSSGTVCRVPL